MATNLQTPEEWLQEQLDKLHVSQNEFARRAGLSESAMSNFRAGRSGADTAIQIANYLNIPSNVTLALLGKAPPPATTARADAERLAHIYVYLPEDKQSQLMNYAEYLRAQS